MPIESEMQVLLTGCYRTGSTYLTHLLSNAPAIATEMHLTNFMRDCYGEYDPISQEDNYTSLVFDAARMIRLRRNRHVDANHVLDVCEREEEVTYGTVYDALMRDLIAESIPNWAEKTQLVWREIPDFLAEFDDGKAILIVRDPRSVLASFRRFTYAPDPRYLGAVFNSLDAMQKGREYKSRLSSERFHLMRYESLMRDPIPTVESMLEFLNLSADHDLLSEEGWTDQSGEPWNANSEFDEGSDFDTEAAINRWRGTLEPWEVTLCERVTGDMMQAYGYETSDVSVSEEEYIDIIESDEQIRSFYEDWERAGTGVQEFPLDPAEEENWTVNN